MDPIRGQLFHLLEDLIEDRLPSEAFRYQMDSELLSLMVEETVGTEAEARFEQFLHGSFVQIQARSRLEIAPLTKRASEAFAEIRNEVPDPELRKAFSKTGFDVQSCLAMVEDIRSREDILRTLLTAKETSPTSLIAEILQGIMALPQMVMDYGFVGDLNELAADWLSQVTMPEIVDRHLPSGSDERKFHRFMSDYFGFRLPWGAGAYIQLAQHVLALGDELGDVGRWLPTMVRYGVPTPKATWAMTLGCPSREFSALLAGAFVEDHDSAAGYLMFLDWFSSLTEEDFILRLGATSSEAEILMRRSNALVPNDRKMTETLRASVAEYDTGVAGLGYDNRRSLLPMVTIGAPLHLRRDYRNQYDSNAIEVLVGESVLGYVPRVFARMIAPQMDAGFPTTAISTEVEQGQFGTVEIHIEVAALDVP